ncbi:hypothetical protein [Agrobacterium fabrum]|uniref:hypothetical protein n=1 Tax=Agrobacterium fabrum TaxID=1176649 RepID=UPI003B9E2F8C
MNIAVDPLKMPAPQIIDRTKMKPAILPVFLLLKRLRATFVASRAKLVFEKNIARETSHPE